MRTFELCGEDAPGGPCTLEKGHRLEYHRHRVYNKVDWEIKSEDGELLESGSSRVPMNYAITRAFKKNSNLVISLKQYDSPTK